MNEAHMLLAIIAFGMHETDNFDGVSSDAFPSFIALLIERHSDARELTAYFPDAARLKDGIRELSKLNKVLDFAFLGRRAKCSFTSAAERCRTFSRRSGCRDIRPTDAVRKLPFVNVERRYLSLAILKEDSMSAFIKQPQTAPPGLSPELAAEHDRLEHE